MRRATRQASLAYCSCFSVDLLQWFALGALPISDAAGYRRDSASNYCVVGDMINPGCAVTEVKDSTILQWQVHGCL